jgi:hypothetical protein
MADEIKNPEEFEPGPASSTKVSLSQILLAPLDSIFKAQIHAARSFLNLLLQIGYPHIPVNKDGEQVPDKGTPYNLDFNYEVEANGKRETRKISIPALALVPVSPLAVESAAFKIEMKAELIERHEQLQESEKRRISSEEQAGYSRQKRPWFLVSDPISIRGTLAPQTPGNAQTQASQGSTIQMEVKVSRIPMPAGLDKLLTSLTQLTQVSSLAVPKENNQKEAGKS